MRRIFALIGFALVACYSIGEGIAPPLGSIYFPTGLTLSRDSNFLYVANSDFDLQYNAGTLQSLDLNRIRSLVPRGCASDSDCPAEKYCDAPGSSTDTPEHSYWCVDRDPASKFFGLPCGALGERSSSDRVTVPGRCQAVNLQTPQDGGSSLITDAVAIGAFATDVIARDFPNSDRYADRLFIPVRGESSINWVDATGDGKFDCGQGAGQTCDQRHRAGQDPSDNSRGLRMPPEPYAIAATPDTSAIIVTHQTQGAVSLLVNDWTTGPHLNFVFTGLPPMPIAAAAIPQPLVVQMGLYQTSPGFLIAYETTPRIDLLRFSPDSESTPSRPYLELSATATVTANSGGYDVRGLAVDDSARVRCEADGTANDACLADCAVITGDAERLQCQSKCADGDASRLMTCANIPLDMYASSRSPASLLIGHTTPNTALTPNSDIPTFNDTFPLPTGPSRIQVAQIINEQNRLETRVFIVSFDSRRIAIFDPAKRNIEAWVITGRGPQALAFDVLAPSGAADGHAFAFVGHFTDSYLGVVELDRRRGRSYGTIVLSLGPATAPRASK
jgi:DNA-binding beta-propeller fold protein YncE